jgi:glycosyltransferase involved in cell wall biosynthesis
MKQRIKIGFASTDWSRSMNDDSGHPVPGGANWVRIQQNRKFLKYQSVTGLLIHSPVKGFGIASWDKKPHYDCDIIVLQRLMFDKLVDKLDDRKKFGQVLLNDVDDWYWGLHKENHAYKLTHPDYNKEENIDLYRQIIEKCDGVVVSTPFLKERFEQDFDCERVHMVENCVTMSDFRVRYHRPRKPKVGWVGSTSHRSGDLELLKGVLDAGPWKVHHSGHVQGAVPFSNKVGLPPNMVTTSPMHHPLNYARLSFEFDIGLAPIVDIPFNRAKSWIKAIEYTAAGIPVVMSDVAEYRRLHEEYGIGRLASSPDDWIRHLSELRDYPVRVKEAKENREKLRPLDVRTMASNWDKVLDSYL